VGLGSAHWDIEALLLPARSSGGTKSENARIEGPNLKIWISQNKLGATSRILAKRLAFWLSAAHRS